jgi:hypothetical protein
VIESGGEVRFGRHDDIDAFTQRIGYLERIQLRNVRSNEGVGLSVGFGDRIELVIVGPFFLRVASIVRETVALRLVVGRARTARAIPGGVGVGFGIGLGERVDTGGRITRARTAEVKG